MGMYGFNFCWRNLTFVVLSNSEFSLNCVLFFRLCAFYTKSQRSEIALIFTCYFAWTSSISSGLWFYVLSLSVQWLFFVKEMILYIPTIILLLKTDWWINFNLKTNGSIVFAPPANTTRWRPTSPYWNETCFAELVPCCSCHMEKNLTNL